MYAAATARNAKAALKATNFPSGDSTSIPGNTDATLRKRKTEPALKSQPLVMYEVCGGSGQLPGQCDKLFERNAFCARLNRQTQSLEYLFQFIARPIFFQQFKHHLTALGKTMLNDFGKCGFL